MLWARIRCSNSSISDIGWLFSASSTEWIWLFATPSWGHYLLVFFKSLLVWKWGVGFSAFADAAVLYVSANLACGTPCDSARPAWNRGVPSQLRHSARQGQQVKTFIIVVVGTRTHAWNSIEKSEKFDLLALAFRPFWVLDNFAGKWNSHFFVY